jgi:hypothetical protein
VIGSFRVLHRGRRAPLLAGEIARLLAGGRPRERFRADLLPLFQRVWRRGRDSTWTCAELARLGLVDPRATQRLGRDLRRQFNRDEPVGPFVLERRGHERDGVTWSLRRVR